jgi:hypothetical protein
MSGMSLIGLCRRRRCRVEQRRRKKRQKAGRAGRPSYLCLWKKAPLKVTAVWRSLLTSEKSWKPLSFVNQIEKMGSSSDRDLAIKDEQARRQAQLPDTLDEAVRIIGELSDDVRVNQRQIEVLQEQLRVAGTWRSKISDWILGGFVGAIIGILIGFIG